MKTKHILSIVVLILIGLLFPTVSYSPKIFADGMVIPPADYYVEETGQKAVIYHNGKRETLIISTQFKGDAQDFGWIIPVPSKPEVDKGQDSLFTALEEFTRPKYPEPYPLYEKSTNLSVGEGVGKQAVTVWETKQIDIYSIQIVSATDAKALAKWFNDNNYPYPTDSSFILNSYINNGWYFIASKILTEAVESPFAGQLATGHATPLKISFDTNKIVYPLKISSITTSDLDKPPKGEPQETEWRQFKDHLYKRIWTGSDNWYQARVACQSQSADLTSITSKEENDFVTNLCGKGNICRLGHTNPSGYCQKPFNAWVDGEPVTFENWAPGEPQFACAEDCLDISIDSKWNNEWCNNPYEYRKFSICEKPNDRNFITEKPILLDSSEKETGQTVPGISKEEFDKQNLIDKQEMIIPIKPRLPKAKQVSILLYIFSDHKKEIPNFTTQYAGFVKAKDIEKLAQDDNGNPWIKTEGKKMYLTKLSRYMQTLEMTEDLFPQNAENDKSVNQDNPFSGFEKMAFVGIPFLFELLILGFIIIRRKANK